MRKRIPKLLSLLGAAACLFGVVIATPSMAPTASADPLGDIRGPVNGARAQSTCPPLNYNISLESFAQQFAGNTSPGVPQDFSYVGERRQFIDKHDPANTAAAVNQARATINDCNFKDFGVGFSRDDANEVSVTTIVLGAPPKVATRVPCPAGSTTPDVAEGQQCTAAPPVQCPPNSKSPTVPAGQQCEAAAPTQCPPGSAAAEVPAGQQCQGPTNAVSMNITQEGLNANVAVTNNSALPAECAYTATKTGGLVGPGTVTRNVSVPANGTGNITDMLWPPPLVSYRATVKCTATYDGKQVSIGESTQNVQG